VQCSGETHCCRIRQTGGSYQDCPNLVENQGGRRYACALFLRYGNWDDVLTDPDYPGDVWGPGINCRDWPGPGDKCLCLGSR
jgi:hypothetical protein